MPNTLWKHALVAVPVILAVLLYWPGLGAPFRFDDFSNLGGLAHFAQQPGLETAWFYLTSGGAGPLGRPVSLLTFLFQAGNFPGNPAAFQVVNLAIHGLCGVLVFLLTQSLGRRLDLALSERQIVTAALVAAGCWLLQPMFVSTVLYPVQRMAQLSTLFCLMGVLAWLHARRNFEIGHYRQGTLAFAGTLLCGALGLLSKENAAVLPLIIIAIELALPATSSREWQRLRNWSLGSLVVIGGTLFFTYWFEFIQDGYASRSFTLSERLLTESRVLLQYLGLLLLPLPAKLGLIQDDFVISTGLLTPLSTVFALAFWILSGILAFTFRHRTPALALACFWFLGAHAVESGLIPLEIYFEHRNYLPAAGLYAGLALACAPWLDRSTGRLVAGALLATFSLILLGQTLLWADPARHAKDTLARHPDSLRAHMQYASRLQHHAGIAASMDFLQQVQERFPGAIDPASSQLALPCLNASLEKPDLDPIRHAFRNGGFTYLPLNHMDRLIAAKASGKCTTYSVQELLELVHALQENPAFTRSDRSRRYLHILEARLLHLDGDAAAAIDAIEQAAAIEATVDLWLQAARWALETGQEDRARGFLERADQLSNSPLDARRIATLREQLADND